MSDLTSAAATQGVAPWRTVLADDAVDLRLTLARLLQRDERFVVVGQAGDGKQALEVVGREQPDLLVLDLSMPVMDGFSVLEVMPERFPETVVVVLSGFAGHQMEQRALELGAACYIEKGYMFDRLHAVLAEAMTQREP